jgi:hypothetical protein
VAVYTTSEERTDMTKIPWPGAAIYLPSQGTSLAAALSSRY